MSGFMAEFVLRPAFHITWSQSWGRTSVLRFSTRKTLRMVWDPAVLCPFKVKSKRRRKRWISWSPQSPHTALNLSSPDAFLCQRERFPSCVSCCHSRTYLDCPMCPSYLPRKNCSMHSFHDFTSPSSCVLSSVFRILFTITLLLLLCTLLQSLLRVIKNTDSSREGSFFYDTATSVGTESLTFTFQGKEFLILTSFQRQIHFTLRLYILTYMILKLKMINYAGSNITQTPYNTVWDFFPFFSYFLSLTLCIHFTVVFFKSVFQDYKCLKTT